MIQDQDVTTEFKLYDDPSKSWDVKSALKKWSRMTDDEASTYLGPWVKNRYRHKYGVPDMKNMDRAVAALSDIEIKALIEFTKTSNYKCLGIPVYELRNLVEDATEVVDDNACAVAHEDDILNVKAKRPTAPENDVRVSSIRATQFLSSHKGGHARKNKSNQRCKHVALARNSDGKRVAR